MLLLDAASKLQILSSNAAISLDFTVSKVRNAAPQIPTPSKGNLAAAGPADLCAVPGGTDVDTVEEITVCNVHATNSTDVTVNHVGGTTVRVFKVVALGPGESIVWTEGGVLFVYDAMGRVKSGGVAGAFIQTTVLTAASGNFTTGPTTTKIKVRLIAGGGAGGGAATVAAGGGAGGGGAAGGYAEKDFVVTPNTAYAYVNGAAGAAGAAGANAGGVGGDTTFTVGGVTVTAKGGPGGTGMASGTTVLAALGGAPAPISTNGDVNASGMPGNPGIRLSGTIGVSGAGGDAGVYGSGDAGRIAQGNGVAGIGRGAGGSGGLTLNAGVATNGGPGTAGQIVVEEYS